LIFDRMIRLDNPDFASNVAEPAGDATLSTTRINPFGGAKVFLHEGVGHWNQG